MSLSEDDLRSFFVNPMGYVFQMVRAIILTDTDSQAVLLTQIAAGGQFQGVMLVALCELAQELSEHRGDAAALEWCDTRLRIGLDSPDSG